MSKPKSKLEKPKGEPGIGLGRIKTIMKSTADTGPINHEGLFLMARATELFVQYLAKNTFESTTKDIFKYDDLAKLINEDQKLDFLMPIIPPKITYKEYKEILRNEPKSESFSEDDEDEETKSPIRKSPKK